MLLMVKSESPISYIVSSTGQNEREETTQNTTVTQSAACASYKSNYVTYITATYTSATLLK
jgi:hypothetical protein